MNTPIVDFVDRYIASGTRRLHMPGHKGESFLGCEARDITEIAGADALYEAGGIIAESEQNASALFGCPTWYSTEGSSHGIRAMLYLTVMLAKANGQSPRVLASRGAHRVFVSAAALLGIEVVWLPFGKTYLDSCTDVAAVGTALATDTFTAVYITSPDYLGTIAPIEEIAAVCRRFAVPLLVDNAHGAYLRFLSPSRHPMDLGATACCDSAHKTLPALTGAAYLHVAADAPSVFLSGAKTALSMFGSTSPSYLILQSLDRVNAVLATTYPSALAACVAQLEAIKALLNEHGWKCVGDEPLKLTVCPKPFGYRGDELAAMLREHDVECEFADPDYIVLMPTPANGDLAFLQEVFLSVERRAPILSRPPVPHGCEAVMRAHEALLSPQETVTAHEAIGRVLAVPTVSCPPAVPIVMGGERIDEAAIKAFDYYGVKTCTVVQG